MDALPAEPIAVEQREWALLEGLMAGVVVIHAVQPLAAATGELEWTDKKWVAVGGTALYGTALVGHHYRQRWSLYIPIVGPALGLTAVMGGWALDRFTPMELEVRPDAFQLAGASLQVPALLVAWDLLRDDGAHVALGAGPEGFVVHGSW